METASIFATQDVTITVRRAIEQELRARGFKLGSNTSLVEITAELIRFYNDHKNGFFAGDAIAALNMSVTVELKGEQLYSRHVVAQGFDSKQITITSRLNY